MSFSGSMPAWGMVVLLAATVCEPGTGARLDPGERIYREGILPTGQPVTAIVQGDVPVDGTQFTCVSCHRRSGWGAIEGEIVVLPAAAPALFSERDSGYRQRPAYTDETLLRALREGRDPTGRLFDPLMPRYELSDEDGAALVAYLKTLSLEPSPGVTDEEIHIGTVITSDVEPARRRAVVDVLEAYVRAKNGGTRNERGRLEKGAFYRDYKDKAYRKWVLHPWLLEGDPSSWPEQLASFYEKEPVFALVSGVSGKSWNPVHEFCETRRLPCVLPNTDQPVISESGHYTTYFSKGTRLDAEIVASVLEERPTPSRVLQVYRVGSSGEFAARAFLDAARGLPHIVSEVALEPSEPIGEVRLDGYDVLLLWLEPVDLDAVTGTGNSIEVVYLSGTLLGPEPPIPDALKAKAMLIQPYRLEKEREGRFLRVRGWLGSRDIPLVDERLQSQTYFACMMLGEGLMHMRRYFYREYFIELLEHADRMTSFSAFYPRLSIGPGQRYLAKGAYVVGLGDYEGAEPRWVVPQ